MQKLKNSMIGKMIAAGLTSKEIDFLIYVSRFQDSTGKSYGIHYRELCKAMHMSYQEFYNAKVSLEEKGFIRCEKTHRTDHDITLIGNLEADCLRDGYVNTNHNIFYQASFYRMKAGAKLLALEMMKITYAGKGYFEIGVKKFYEKYTTLFGVTRRVMRRYLMELKVFFSVGIKDRKYYITPKKAVYRKLGAKSESERLREHCTEAILRRNRIKEGDEKKKRDVRDLFQQYAPEAAEKGKNLLLLMERAVERSLIALNQGEKRIRTRVLNAPLIHKLLKEELNGTSSEAIPQGNDTGHRSCQTVDSSGRRQYDYKELERMLLNTLPAGE